MHAAACEAHRARAQAQTSWCVEMKLREVDYSRRGEPIKLWDGRMARIRHHYRDTFLVQPDDTEDYLHNCLWVESKHFETVKHD